MIGDDETNFPDKLLLTNRQVANLHKALADKSSTDIKLSKTRISSWLITKNRITINEECD